MTGLPTRAAAPRRLVPRQRAPFDRVEALRFAEAAWALPPARPHIRRPEPRGALVQRFVLPLELLRVQNATRGGINWVLALLKENVAAAMAAQCLPRPAPLQGRPQVLCCRFSSVEPDRFADGFKVAVDMLCVPPPPLTRKGTPRRYVPTLRLGFLVDDSPRHADVECWWEPAPPKAGLGVISIYTGD